MRFFSALLALGMLAGLFAGCQQENGKDVPNEDETSAVQNKTAIVAYNSVGYGHEWLETLAADFNAMYAEEGYKIELKVSPNMAYGNQPNLEIRKGAERNDVDMYIDAANLENLLDASDKVMRGKGAVLVDLIDKIWNQPAITLGADGKPQEESKTIAERFLLDDTNLYYDGAKEKFHGVCMCCPPAWSCGAPALLLTPLFWRNLDIPQTIYPEPLTNLTPCAS